MGKDTATLPGVGAGASDAKPVLRTSTPPSRKASFEAKRGRVTGKINEAFPGGARFLIADHHHGKYPTLFGASAGHPYGG